MLLSLDIIKFKEELQIKELDGKRMIFCLIRKKWLVITPEELVRQLTLFSLIKEKGFSRTNINVEKALSINKTMKRFDIVVYSKSAAAQILIECKAPNVKLNQAVFDQAGQYNLQLKAPFLLVTNGVTAYSTKINFETRKVEFLDQIPTNTLVNNRMDH